ncbi:AAA family ATPase, partial [Pseudomonas aeruginosa]|nr:AAA family ATPase [Pseudomonas aeruginosa]
MTPAQDKLIRTFRANLDEHMHIQGYAGIGKSNLLGALRECLRPENTLVLAHTEGKLEALRRRMGGAHAKETS